MYFVNVHNLMRFENFERMRRKIKFAYHNEYIDTRARASTLNTNFNQLKTLEKVNAYKSFNQISLIHICAANAYANVVMYLKS